MDRKFSQEVVERRAVRRNLVRSADRSEKIRTYNFAQVSIAVVLSLGRYDDVLLQDRVTDHRIGLSMKNLASVMEGEGLQDILKALERKHHEELLQDVLEE